MEIIIILLLVAVIIALFYLLRPSSGEKPIAETRQVPIETQAETGTDKLLRKLDEKENAEYNAELKTRRKKVKANANANANVIEDASIKAIYDNKSNDDEQVK